MTPEQIGGMLQQKFGSAILEAVYETLDPWVTVSPEKIVDVATFLKNEAETSFDFLRSIAGVDYPPDTIEVVYFLFSYTHQHSFKLKVKLPRTNPTVASLEAVWPAAGWHEREAFDLLGVTFTGNSDLRRILLPDDWVGYPLRKDYQEQDSYHGVSTTREYQTGMPELPTHPSMKGPNSGATH